MLLYNKEILELGLQPLLNINGVYSMELTFYSGTMPTINNLNTDVKYNKSNMNIISNTIT